MTYEITFTKSAKKDWDKLDHSIRQQFKQKLIKRIENPHVAKDRLSAHEPYYKIKLRTVGYRLVYRVIDNELIIDVIVVARRDHDKAYNLFQQRIQQEG